MLHLNFIPAAKSEYIKSIYLADLMLKIGSNISIFFDKFIEDHVISGDISITANLFSWEESRKNRAELKEIKSKNLLNPRWQGWNWANYKKLEPILSLSDRHVLLIPLNETIYPFKYNGKRTGKSWIEIIASETDFWWNSYNKIKHNAAFRGANLNIVIQALAALFLLFIASNLIYSKKAVQYNYITTYHEEEFEQTKFSTRLFSI